MAEIMNSATINFSFSGSSEEFSETSNIATVNLLNSNGISVEKSANTSVFVPGGTVTYVVTITNTGNEWLSGVRLTDNLSGNGYLTYVPGSAVLTYNGQALAPQIASTNPLVFTLSPLVSGQTMVLNYTCRIPANISSSVNEITNTVTGIGYTYNSTVEDTSSYTITRSPSADLSITKTASAENISVGQTFNYVITATNSSTSVASVQSLTDNLPDNFVIETVSLKIGSGPVTVLSPDQYTISAGNLLTVPSSTGPIITVPARSGSVNGTTVLTISGHFDNTVVASGEQ